MKSLNLSKFSHILRDIDISYREKKKTEHREKEYFKDRNHEHDHKQTRDHDRDHNHTQDDRKKNREYSKSTTINPRIDLHKESNEKRKSKDEKNGRRDKKKRSFKNILIPEILPKNQ